MAFEEIVTSEAALREIVGAPSTRAVAKEIASLDVHCRAIISRSPFVVIASGDAEGRMDVSPKGDPAGFVAVLDDHTLAIPDRPGNRRVDTFRNVLRNPRVGLLFLVPGRAETLRVNGRAAIVRDAGLRQRLAVRGKPPELVLVVSVEEVFVHCGKCMIRSGLWEPQRWPESADLPSHARCLLDQAKPAESIEQVQASVEESYKSRLY